jgi:hypothetical protein
MPRYPKFAKGTIVLNNYGQMLEVVEQRGCQVWVRDIYSRGGAHGWYHPTKIRRYSGDAEQARRRGIAR